MACWAHLAYECAVRNRPAARKAAKLRGKATPKAAAAGSSARGSASLLALPNLGPAFVGMLAQAGIRSESALRKAGAVTAFAHVKALFPEASLQLLWALEGALSGRASQDVSESDRTSLLMALEDVTRHQPGRPDR